MSNKLKYSLIITLIVCFTASPSLATIKIDVAKAASTVSETAGKIYGEAQDVVKQVEHNKTALKALDGFKEGAAKLKDLKGQFDGAIGAASKLKASVQNAGTQLGSQVSSLGTSISASNAQELIRVQTNQAQAKKNYETQIQDIKAERDAQLVKYKDNNLRLEQMKREDATQASAYQSQIDENNAKIKEITDKYQKMMDNSTQVFERANASYERQMETLKKAATNVDPLKDAKASGKKAISGMFGGDPGPAMNEVIKNNFYSADETPSAERNGEIATYRQNVALNDTADVLYQSVYVMSAGDIHSKTAIDAYNEYIESLRSNAQVTETTPGAVTLDLSLKVENMKVLLNYARLLVAELKMVTANDMIGMDKKLNNYSKDVTAFNMDDYEYKKPKESLKDKASKLKDFAGSAAAKVTGFFSGK